MLQKKHTKMTKDYDSLVRIILIGDTYVGKTCLLSRYVDDQFIASCPATLAVDFRIKRLKIDGKRIKLQIWDTAGQERFDTVTKQYYRRAQGVIVVYDVSNKKTFGHLDKWLESLKEYAQKDVEVTIVGNKVDLEELRQVSKLQGAEFAATHKLRFFEASSYGADGLDEVFQELIRRILRKNDILRANCNGSTNESHSNNVDQISQNGRHVFEIEDSSNGTKKKEFCCTS